MVLPGFRLKDPFNPKSLDHCNMSEAMVPGDRVICFECRKEPERDGKVLLLVVWRVLF